MTYGIRDGRSISYSDFLTLKEAYPELKEQQKIGEFFNKIDHVISLQQEKLTHYQSIKKFLLQQMFI